MKIVEPWLTTGDVETIVDVIGGIGTKIVLVEPGKTVVTTWVTGEADTTV